MKLSWEEAPDWAKFLAMDDSGVWFWYENKPNYIEKIGWWMHTNGKYLSYHNNNAEYMIEKRP